MDIQSFKELIDHYEEPEIQSLLKHHHPWEHIVEPFSTEFYKGTTTIIPTIGSLGDFHYARRLSSWCLPLRDGDISNQDIIYLSQTSELEQETRT